MQEVFCKVSNSVRFQVEGNSMISDDVWMETLNVRNRLIHDYDGGIIKQYCTKIVDVYIDKFYQLRDEIK